LYTADALFSRYCNCYTDSFVKVNYFCPVKPINAVTDALVNAPA